jgi:hypothetical protein
MKPPLRWLIFGQRCEHETCQEMTPNLNLSRAAGYLWLSLSVVVCNVAKTAGSDVRTELMTSRYNTDTELHGTDVFG